MKSKNKNFKKKIEALTPPAVPLHAAFIHMIIQTNNKFQKEEDTSGPLVEFKRIKSVGDILWKFMSLVRVIYQFQFVPAIQQYITRKRTFLDIDEFFKSLPPAPIETQQTTFSTGGSTSRENGSTGGSLGRDSQSNPGSGVSPQQFKFFVIDLIFNDEEFRDELTKLTKEVMQEELTNFKQEINELTQYLQPLTKEPEGNEELLSTNLDPRARDIINQEYPGCSIIKWTFFDSRGTVNGSPQNVSANIVKGDSSRNLFEVLQTTNVQDIERIIKIGKLYKSQNPNHPLSCFIITGNVLDNVMNIANKCKIKIFKL